MTLLKDKKSNDKWSESSDTVFLDENNSRSSDTESDKKPSARTSATQDPIANSQNNFRCRKKQPFSFDRSFKGEYFPPPPLDPISLYQYFEVLF